MKEYRGPSGDRRLWYEPDEIEEIMLDELHRAGLVPNGEQDDASVDIEAFVEKHLGLSFDLSAELDTDVLGATDFIPGHRPKISVNRDLTGSALDEEDATPGLIGRWRATVAHEASHVLLHRLLYEPRTTCSAGSSRVMVQERHRSNYFGVSNETSGSVDRFRTGERSKRTWVWAPY